MGTLGSSEQIICQITQCKIPEENYSYTNKHLAFIVSKNFCFSPNITRFIKTMRRVRLVACMGDRNCCVYRVLVVILMGKNHLEDLGSCGRIISIVGLQEVI